MSELNGNDAKLGEKSKGLLGAIGLPTLIIAVFWVLTLVAGHFVGISMSILFSDTLKRAGMNGILSWRWCPPFSPARGRTSLYR